MNETEYLSLPAAERFELLADKVMGGEVKHHAENLVTGRITFINYDYDADWWRIVERMRMREQGWTVMLSLWMNYQNEPWAECKLVRKGRAEISVANEKESRAVQLASLRAVGEIE